MAIRGAIQIGHDGVFPHGCYVVGEVEPVRDFDRSTKETPVQAVDKDTGMPVWQVDVVDADPDARDKSVRVKILATVQPVPPATAPGLPFRPVEFDNLTVMPYVATLASGRGKLAWSFKATGMHAPASAAERSKAG
jgi:hypothetical protein